MKIIAKIDCKINNVYYKKGNEIDVPNKQALIKLNEMGFIEPLTPIEIQNWKKEEPIRRILTKKEE